jgi:glycosyltransferase involved in cell wall biosynthesis
VLLSVIVPVFDIQAYVGNCLRSLADQDLGPDAYEVIVIDDGSTDDSLSVARDLVGDDPRFKILSQANRGISAARNRGLDLAVGDYVFFVDGDDYIAAGVLAPLVRIIQEHRLEVLGFGRTEVKPGEVLRRSRHATDVPPDLEVMDGISYMGRVDLPNNVWQWLFDRRFLDGTGIRFEVGRVMEDQVFMAAIFASVQRVAVIPWDVNRYVVRPDSIMRDRSHDHGLRMIRDYERVIVGLDMLRQRTVDDGSATPGFLARLAMRQENFVFFLIARVIRSRIPVRPVLPQVLSRLQGMGVYPMTVFPGADHAPMQLRVLTAIFNRRYLLYPFASIYRVVARLRRRLLQSRR